MTLAIAAVTRELAFVGADRRYSGVGALRSFKAVKVCALETSDASGLLTFAGVGARARAKPFELSDWLTQVLRGVIRTLDESLHQIALAATEQRLHSLVEGHAFAFAGFKEGQRSLQLVTSNPELYAIPLVGQVAKLELGAFDAPFKVVNVDVSAVRGVRSIVLGSGVPFLPVRMIIEADRMARRAATKEKVGERWAHLWSHINRVVANREPTVGRETICAWRHRGGGGSHFELDSRGRLERSSSRALPSVRQGLAISEISDRLLDHLLKRLETHPGDPHGDMSDEVVDRLMQGLSTAPDTTF